MKSLERFELNELETLDSIFGGASDYKTTSIGPTRTHTVFLGFIINTGEICDTDIKEDK